MFEIVHSELFLPLVHCITMLLFLIVLVDCAWKKLLLRCVGQFSCFQATKKLKVKGSVRKVKKIYQKFEKELKMSSSNVIKSRLEDGKSS